MDFGLHIQTEEKQGKTILRLEGRIDASTSNLLEKEINDLIEKKHLSLLVDFFEVEYLSSAGMRVLLSGAKKMKNSGGNFLLFGMNDEVMEIIKMAGFEKILRIFSSEKEALSALQG